MIFSPYLAPVRPALDGALGARRQGGPQVVYDFTGATLPAAIASIYRTGAATFINAAGNLAYGPHNLLTNSHDLTAAAWSASGGASKSGQTIVMGAGVGAFGLVSQAILAGSAPAGVYTWGALLSATGADIGRTVTIDFSGSGLSASRSITLTDTPTLYTLTSPSWAGGFGVVRIISYGGNTATQIVFNGAALVFGASLTPADVVPNSTSSALYLLRQTYSPAGAPLGLLLEGAATQQVKFTTDFANAAWVVANGASKVGPAASYGQMAGVDWYEINLGSTPSVPGNDAGGGVAQILSLTEGTAYATSIWVRTKTGTSTVRLDHYTGAGRAYTSDIAISTTPKRIDLGFTQSGSSTAAFVLRNNTTGNSGSILVAAPQIEAGPVASSYIPNPTTGTMTRAADPTIDLTGADFSALFGSMTQGTIIVEWYDNGSGATSDILMAHAAGSIGESIGVYRNGSSPTLWARSGGVNQAIVGVANNIVSSGRNKIAFRFAANNFAIALNGGTVATDTSGTVPACTHLRLYGATMVSGGPFDKTLTRLSRLPYAASDAELQALSTL